MSEEIGAYSFLPWLRVGIANKVQAAGPPTPGATRATIEVALQLAGEGVDGDTLTQPLSKDIQLYGPGDIVGIDGRAILKTEPRNWITDFESNYLPCIDFYDEDFPWRYTPEAPQNQHRLRPWIMLVVLAEDEFVDAPNIVGRPLPAIEVAGAEALFPPADQLWAWAHVHVNRDLAASAGEIVATDTAAFLPRFAATLQENPDLAYSRILCPRQLTANTAYHAFLVPVFETGRLAGLGLDPAQTPGVSHAAWDPYPAGTKAEPANYPYYHRWYFRTGTVGDFEYLVRLLQPRPVDKRVGRRDMDVQAPGSNLTGITNSELGGVLKLGGALQVPLDTLAETDQIEVAKYENWDQPYPHPFQNDLAAFINLADDYQAKSVADAHTDTTYDATIPDPDDPTTTQIDPDPLITPPLYGRWHALTARLLTARDGTPLSPNDNWVHELNLDPRFRVAAAFGTKVVQQNQENYMNAAWAQIGDVLAAYQRIRLAQLAQAAAERWYQRYLLPLESSNGQKALLLTTPVQKRVVVPTAAGGATAYHHVNTSIVPYAVTSTAARRLLRPRGRLMQALPFDPLVSSGQAGAATPDNLIERINAGEVTPARPKGAPEGAVTIDDVADAASPIVTPPFLVELLLQYRWLLGALIIIALFCLFAFWPLGMLLLAGIVYLYRQMAEWRPRLDQVESLNEAQRTPDVVDRLPRSPDFRLSRPGEGVTFNPDGRDSVEAVRFKTALKDAFTLIEASGRAAFRPAPAPLDLPALTGTVFGAINPQFTIPRHVYHTIYLPGRIRDQIGERFVEPMAYPEIDAPMYKPLVDLSSELFLPNINFIEQNTISLLETNQRFIEAYMVGLNHEFARELLWREYLTDQRGSYFRQFWDVSTYLDSDGTDLETLREKLKDIPPLHRWSESSQLGDHDHRETGESEEELVLVIRGELLKKYPTAVIYAHRARWQRREDGTIDNTLERRLEDLTSAEAEKPPPTKVKSPLYEAKVDPDIYFFGFDLKATEARGGTGENEGDDPGWFFVIKERPGEPRFGLDIGQAETINVWNDLGWENVLPGAATGAYIQINATTPEITVSAPPPAESEKSDQFEDDKAVKWHKDTDAAELAYILYQAPVLVAVHAAEMLPR